MDTKYKYIILILVFKAGLFTEVISQSALSYGFLRIKKEFYYGFNIGVQNDAKVVLGVNAGITNKIKNLYGFQIGINNASQNGKIYGIQSGLVNKNSDSFGINLGLGNKKINTTGFQFGLINSNSKIGGIQIGIYNWVKQLYGIQLGLINYGPSKNTYAGLNFSFISDFDNFQGFRFAALNDTKNNMYGCQIGFMNGNITEWHKSSHIFNECKGVSIGGFNLSEHFAGLCVGLNNKSDKMDGLSLGLINRVKSKDAKGIQAGVLNRTSSRVYGLQAGILNYAKSMYGLQTGLVNFTSLASYRDRHFFHIQIGLFNWSKHSGSKQIGIVNINRNVQDGPGIQFGLINYYKVNPWYMKYLPIINFSNEKIKTE